MRYLDPQLADRLAAEYALGTLRGRARARFEGLAAAHPTLRARVRYWEATLQRSMAPPPVEPPPEVWGALTRRLFSDAPERPRPWYRRLVLWRALGAASSVLAVALAAALYVAVDRQPTWGVVLANLDTNRPTWLISANQEMGVLHVRNMRAMTLPDNLACLLWVQPAGSDRFYLVGRLPDEGEEVIRVSRDMLPVMNGTLWVTVEDISGAVPPQPASSPLYRGDWVSLKAT